MNTVEIHAALAAQNAQVAQNTSICQRVYRWIECQVKTSGINAGIRAAENTVDGQGPYGCFEAARNAASNFLARHA